MIYVALYLLIGLMVTAYLSNKVDDADLKLGARIIGVILWPIVAVVLVFGFVEAFSRKRE